MTDNMQQQPHYQKAPGIAKISQLLNSIATIMAKTQIKEHAGVRHAHVKAGATKKPDSLWGNRSAQERNQLNSTLCPSEFISDRAFHALQEEVDDLISSLIFGCMILATSKIRSCSDAEKYLEEL